MNTPEQIVQAVLAARETDDVFDFAFQQAAKRGDKLLTLVSEFLWEHRVEVTENTLDFVVDMLKAAADSQ